MMSITDYMVLSVIGVTSGIFIYLVVKSMVKEYYRGKQKRKRKPEYDPYIDTEQAKLDRINRLKSELNEAQEDLRQYMIDKMNNEAYPQIFIATNDDMIRIERDGKLLAYLRKHDTDEN